MISRIPEGTLKNLLLAARCWRTLRSAAEGQQTASLEFRRPLNYWNGRYRIIRGLVKLIAGASKRAPGNKVGQQFVTGLDRAERKRTFSGWLVLATLLWTLPVWGQNSAPFKQALPGYQYTFPRDFFSHDDYRIEWWYYTGNLQDEANRKFGYQLTFFRVALDPDKALVNPSRWKIDHIYFAHMTVTDLKGDRFYFFERINRPSLGLAGARSNRLHVWNEDWVLKQEGPGHRLMAVEEGTGLDLTLVPGKPLVLHGQDGVSQKGEGAGNASHYFSFTRMATTGTITIKGKSYRVSGTSWMDHEYSSNQLNPAQIGWDWFAFKLDDGTDLMLYQIRLKNGGIDPYSSGTQVTASGKPQHLKRGSYTIRPTGQWESKHSGIVYPSGWSIHVPALDLHLTITPDREDQELYQLRSINRSYWEGSVTVSGHSRGEKIVGKGYVELVGYGKALEQKLPE